MAPPISNRWTTHPEYIDLLNYLIQKAKDAKSPMNILSLAKEFKEKSGTSQSVLCLHKRISKLCTKIHNFEHIDTDTKVKLMFALSASVDDSFMKRIKKDAFVKLDNKKRITHYKASDGGLELRGDHSRSSKISTGWLKSKGSIRSIIKSYFENKNGADAVLNNESESEMWQLIEFITENCQTVDSPLSICKLTKNFIQSFESSVPFETIRKRIIIYGREIQKMEYLDTQTKVQQLFCLSASVDSDYLEKLRKDAIIEVDDMNRITKYTANNGRLTLYGDHSRYAKRTLSWIMRRPNKITGKKNSNSEDKSDEYSSEEFRSEFDSDEENDPLNEPDHMDSSNEALDFDNETPIRNRSQTDISIDDNFDFNPQSEKSHRSEETERSDDEENDSEITANASVKTRYGRLSKRRNLDSEFSYSLANSSTSATPRSTNPSSSKSAKQKKIAIEKEQASSSSNQSTSSSRPIRRSIGRSPSPSFSTESAERMRNQDAPDADGNPSDYHGSRIQAMDEYEYNPREDNFESHPIDNQLEEPKPQANEEHNKNNEVKNNDLDKTQDPMEPSNEAYNSDNETPVISLAQSGISTDDDFDFDPPTERSHAPEETEMRKDDENDPETTENAAVKTQRFETLPKNKTSSSTSHTPKTRKRKADASDGSSTSKRTKPLPEESMVPGNSKDNISDDDPPRVKLNPSSGPLELPKETRKVADIQQIPKPRPQVMEAPIKKEYEEEAHTSLKMVLNAFKSLILGLDTTGLAQLQMEIDTKIEETGRGVEVPKKEVIMAMELFIVKLSKHGALKSSEEAISLRDILLMLRMIILNSRFNGFEVILEMLKENIENLKVLDKKVPVSKVECVLRATVDSISI
ncbi:unnamed protein product [Caenorhabditis brenneri]